MSQNNIEISRQFANMTVNSWSHSIQLDDYKSIFQALTSVKVEAIKVCLKDIMLILKTEDNIFKFINNIVDILKTDLNNWHAIENIKTIFNEIEMVYVSLYGPARTDKVAFETINKIIENVFTNYIKDVEMQLNKYVSNSHDVDIYCLHLLLLNFTQLLEIKNFEPILYPMAKFGERLFEKYDVPELQRFIVEFILHINHRLVNYLAVVPGNPVSKGLKESIHIYDKVRSNIVTLTYADPDIITKALGILEHRSRFFGLTADAIPENENHGDYIVVDPLNTAFEDDDVYDDYERFLANLPS